MSGSSDHWGDAMHDFYSRDPEDDFDADGRWEGEMKRRRDYWDRVDEGRQRAKDRAIDEAPTRIKP